MLKQQQNLPCVPYSSTRIIRQAVLYEKGLEVPIVMWLNCKLSPGKKMFFLTQKVFHFKKNSL